MQTETSWKISGGGGYDALKPAEMENLGDGWGYVEGYEHFLELTTQSKVA